MHKIASILACAAIVTAGVITTAPAAHAAAYGCSAWKSGNGGAAYCPAGGGSFRATISCYHYDEVWGSMLQYKDGPWLTAGMGSNSTVQCDNGWTISWWGHETR